MAQRSQRGRTRCGRKEVWLTPRLQPGDCAAGHSERSAAQPRNLATLPHYQALGSLDLARDDWLKIIFVSISARLDR